jgi:hypothetical protein
MKKSMFEDIENSKILKNNLGILGLSLLYNSRSATELASDKNLGVWFGYKYDARHGFHINTDKEGKHTVCILK